MKLIKIVTSKETRKNSSIVSSVTKGLTVDFNAEGVAEVSPELALALVEADSSIQILHQEDIEGAKQEIQNAKIEDLATVKAVLKMKENELEKALLEIETLQTQNNLLKEQLSKKVEVSEDKNEETKDSPAVIEAKKKALDSFKKELEKQSLADLQSLIQTSKPTLPKTEWEKLIKKDLIEYIVTH